MSDTECGLLKVNQLNDDGTVDDIYGDGLWHLEQLTEGYAYFGVGPNAEYQFTIKAEGDSLVIEPYPSTSLGESDDE